MKRKTSEELSNEKFYNRIDQLVNVSDGHEPMDIWEGSASFMQTPGSSETTGAGENIFLDLPLSEGSQKRDLPSFPLREDSGENSLISSPTSEGFNSKVDSSNINKIFSGNDNNQINTKINDIRVEEKNIFIQGNSSLPLNKKTLGTEEKKFAGGEAKPGLNLKFGTTSQLHSTEEQRDKIFKEMSEHYAMAQEYFNLARNAVKAEQGNKKELSQFYLDKAEMEFAELLKPFLCNPRERQLASEDIEKVKSNLLNALYNLGEIYLFADKDPEHYQKAAAIFQYCAVFAKKHDTVINPELNISGYSECFLKKAYLVEKAFLESIDIDKREAFDDNGYYNNARKNITTYKLELEKIRGVAKRKLEEISTLTIEKIADRTEEVKKIYQECNSFFVNEDGESGLVQKLLQECHQQLGGPPCEYAIISLGSLALGTMTPWSDLEFAILIEEDIDRYKDYFRNLTKLLHIKVINLGETILPILGIESLNNVKTGNEEDEWFYDDITPRGFSFDGKRWHACKYPLGRKGYAGKPDYELIHTPQEMAKFQMEPKGKEQQDNKSQSKSWFETDKHLVRALKSVLLIEGDKGLLDLYRQEAKKIEGETARERALKLLKEDLSDFSLKLGDEEEGKLMDVKKDIYRLSDRVIMSLVNYYGISAKAGQRGMTVWEALDEMREQAILNPEGAQRLKEAMAIAMELRLNTYYSNFGQNETMSTYIPTVGHMSDEEGKRFVSEIFHIKDTSILHHFYYVMIRVQEIVKSFCNKESNQAVEKELREDKFDYSSYYLKGMVHARFLEYDKAIEHMESARNFLQKNIAFLQDFIFLYTKVGDTEGAICVGIQLLRVLIESKSKYGENPKHLLNIARCYSNLGDAYRKTGEYEEAKKYFQAELVKIGRLYQNFPNPFYGVHVARSYHNLGIAYASMGAYEEAEKLSLQALEIKLRIYKKNTNHPDIALSYNNLGRICYGKGEHTKAISYYKVGLDILLRAYGKRPNHPDIAIFYTNVGNVYSAMGKYKEKKECFRYAEEIWSKIFEHVLDHPVFAISYNNIGRINREKGNYGIAIEFYQKMLDVLEINRNAHEASSNLFDIAHGYDDLGACYFFKGKYKTAIKFYQLGLDKKLCKEKRNPFEVAKSRFDLSIIYTYGGIVYGFNNKGEYEQAHFHANKALNILERIKARTYFRPLNQLPPYFEDLYKLTLIQLGKVALLRNKLDEASNYFKRAGLVYRNIGLYLEDFTNLLHEISGEYEREKLLPAIECQKILIKFDPNLDCANHYHNLALLHASAGNIKEANDAFIQALRRAETPSLNAEYAQFLIIYYSKVLGIKEAITKHLYATISSNEIADKLQYGILEREIVCEVIGALIKVNAIIEVNPKALAYYLLITYPEYIAEADNIKRLLDCFRDYCDSLQDEVSFILLAGAYRLSGDGKIAEENLKHSTLISKIEAIIADKTKWDRSKNEEDFQIIYRYATKLNILALQAIEKHRLPEALGLVTKAFQIYDVILTDQQKQSELAEDHLPIFNKFLEKLHHPHPREDDDLFLKIKQQILCQSKILNQKITDIDKYPEMVTLGDNETYNFQCYCWEMEFIHKLIGSWG